MLRLRLTRQEVGELRQLQARRRWDRLIPFSVNCQRKTWAFATWGLTPEEMRREVGGLSDKLDVIAEEYLRVRESGGRFFLNREGAFYKDSDKNPIPFVTFAE